MFARSSAPLSCKLLTASQDSLASRRRKTTSVLVRQEVVQESLYTLGRSSEVQELMKRFLVNPRAVSATPTFQSDVADSFCAHREPEILRSCAKDCLSLLGLLGQKELRPWLIMDETVWAPTYAQINGLRGMSSCIVGGQWSSNAEEDWSCIPVHADLDFAALPADKLATVTLHFFIKLPDSSKVFLSPAVRAPCPEDRGSPRAASAQRPGVAGAVPVLLIPSIS